MKATEDHTLGRVARFFFSAACVSADFLYLTTSAKRCTPSVLEAATPRSTGTEFTATALVEVRSCDSTHGQRRNSPYPRVARVRNSSRQERFNNRIGRHATRKQDCSDLRRWRRDRRRCRACLCVRRGHVVSQRAPPGARRSCCQGSRFRWRIRRGGGGRRSRRGGCGQASTVRDRQGGPRRYLIQRGRHTE